MFLSSCIRPYDWFSSRCMRSLLFSVSNQPLRFGMVHLASGIICSTYEVLGCSRSLLPSIVSSLYESLRSRGSTCETNLFPSPGFVGFQYLTMCSSVSPVTLSSARRSIQFARSILLIFTRSRPSVHGKTVGWITRCRNNALTVSFCKTHRFGRYGQELRTAVVSGDRCFVDTAVCVKSYTRVYDFAQTCSAIVRNARRRRFPQCFDDEL
jgi:hypothetical protein